MPFQHSPMFAGTYPRVEESCFTWVGSGLTHRHQTRLERLARNKHTSLLRKSVNYGRKKFYSTGPWRQSHKNIYVILTLQYCTNKNTIYNKFKPCYIHTLFLLKFKKWQYTRLQTRQFLQDARMSLKISWVNVIKLFCL